MKTQILKSDKVVISLLALLTLNAGEMTSQQLYDNFEGTSAVSYTTTKTAKLDTLAVNPSPDNINSSERCAKFTRSRIRYDYIKINPKGQISDIGKYASYDPAAEKFRMKVYTTAPVGTLIEIQLGSKKAAVAYPDGTNSQYQAKTTKKGEWEELEFTYVVSPKGSKTSFEEVDQITLLFNPNSSTNDTYYFDDLTGGNIIPSAQPAVKAFRKLRQRN
jgi:hypothetical protein